MTDDDDLVAELRELRAEVDALHHRIGRLESRLDDDTPPDRSRRDRDAPAPTRSPDRQRSEPASGSASASSQGPQGDEASAAASAPDATGGTDERRRRWERDIGTRWLGRVGGVALAVGVVFFIRAAIEAGLLGPLGRVAAGAVAGIALLVGGRDAARRQGYRRWGRVTAGTGLAIAFFSVYAAYGFEAYRTAIETPLWAVLLGLTALVGTTVVVSVSDGDPLVAGEAFLLGYATAYLGLDAGSFVVTPAYAFLLTLGLVVIATIRPWSRYVAVSIPLTYGLVVAWLADFDPGWAVVAGVIAAVFVTYAVGGVALRRRSRPDVWSRRSLWALTPLNAVSAAPLFEWTAREWFPALPVEGVAVAAVALALGGIYAGTHRRSVSRSDITGTTAVVLLGVSAVLAADTFVATVGLVAVGCGAVAAARYGAGGAVRTGGHLVTAVAAGKLLVVDARELPGLDLADPLATATGRPAAFLVVIAACSGLAWWFRGDSFTVPRRGDSVAVATPYLLTATALTVVGLGLELSGFGLSVAWAALGAVLFGGGLRADARLFRRQGVAVFGVTTAKVFLFDTQGLDTVARTISFLVLGAVLLAASYAYARWQGTRPLERFTES